MGFSFDCQCSLGSQVLWAAVGTGDSAGDSLHFDLCSHLMVTPAVGQAPLAQWSGIEWRGEENKASLI